MIDSFQITFTYQEVLNWRLHEERLSWALLDEAWEHWLKEDREAALPWCDTWWGEVEVTPNGYLVTIHGPEDL